MRDIFPEIEQWQQAGDTIALATVIDTWGSSPRTIGAKMAVNQKGEMTGSVSGGCVEGAVVSACLDTLKSGKPKLLHFDIANETAWDVGVACGGQLDVLIDLLSVEMIGNFQMAVDTEDVLSIATVIGGDTDLLGKQVWAFDNGEMGGSVNQKIDQAIISRVTAFDGLQQPRKETVQDGIELFLESIFPPPTLVIVGGVHIAVALVKIARATGYRVIVVDPRRQFGTVERFPEADQIIQKWPDVAFSEINVSQNTAVAFLTHDPKIDDPGLLAVLPGKAYYVGALGSRKTQEARRARLLKNGLDEKYLSRIHGPIGLDLGGRSPEEIALAIMAQVVQKQYLTGD